MKIFLNGKETETSKKNISGLLSELGIKTEGAAVEVNLQIVRKKDYEGFALKEGDRVEIVNFVGGG
jgi:thiamine biosynthesis protein ThiS